VSSSTQRTAVLFAGIAASALLFALAVRPSLSVRGIPGPTIALAESPLFASIWLVVAFAAALVVASIVGKAINAVVGLFVLGCGVGLLAMRSGTIEDFAFGATSSLAGLAVETLVWAVLVLAASVFVFRVSGPLPDAVETDQPRVHGPFGTMAFVSLNAGLLALIGVLVMTVSASKGQALAGTFVGGVLTGLAGRLIAPRTPPIMLFVAPVVFGALGHLVAHLQLKGAPIDAAYVQLQLSRLAYPMPVDWAAGALAGTAVGIGWARSFIKAPDDDRR
jgi:hypothetical protein